MMRSHIRMSDRLPTRRRQPDGHGRTTRARLEQKEVAGLSQGQIVRKRFFRHHAAMISLVVLILILLLAATSIGWGPIPGWWKWDYVRRRSAIQPASGRRWPSSGSVARTSSTWATSRSARRTVGIDNFAQVMRGIQQTLGRGRDHSVC